MLVLLEGLDGTGKSTLARKIADRYEDVKLIKEPGSGLYPVREIVLNNPEIPAMTKELLFMADAAEVKRLYGSRCDLVVCDRGLWSHEAYQYGLLKTGELDADELNILKRLIKTNCTPPDLVVYLSGSLELMEERLAGTPKDAIESKGSEFFKHVLEKYEEIAQLSVERRGHPVLRIDATTPVDISCDIVVSYLHGRGIYATRKAT